MNLKCISLAAVILLAAVASACGGDGAQDLSGAAVGVEEPVEPAPGGEEPVKPADPNVPSDPSKGSAVQPGSGGSSATTPGNLTDAVSAIAPTKRVNYQVLEEACGDNAECLAALEAYKMAIAGKCTSAEVNVVCPQGITEFNTEIPSSQLRAGRVPVGYPSASDVAASVEAVSSGEEPAAGDEPVAVAPESVEKVVITLEEWAATHERTAADMVDAACADEDCKTGLAALIAYIESGCGGIGCPAGAEGFLEEPTAEEVASGELGETFPLTADVIELAKTLKTAPAAP